MMRIAFILIVAAVLLISIGSWSSVNGQPRRGDSGTIAAPHPKPTPIGTGTKVRAVAPQIRIVTPQTGSLSVAALSNANLLVEPLNIRGAEGQEGTVPPSERIFVFNKLKPGRYRVAGELDKYHPVEKVIEIRANKSEAVTLDFQPIIYSLTITTNVNAGEVKYRSKGESLTSVAPILNNKVQLRLPVGEYDIHIEPGEYGYEPDSEHVVLEKDKTIDLPLNRSVESKETLSAIWTKAALQEWEMPATWQDSKRTLLVKGAGVALPREQGFRYYRDFQLASNVQMTNGMAVSFALRARDNQNYYLLQLTGAKADEPHVVRLYLVKNGVARRIRSVPFSSAAAKSMDSGQAFSVSVKMTGYQIAVEINDSETGQLHSLGVLTDPDQNFAVGAVGIAARGEEENVIERFVVCTGAKCTGQ